MLNAVRQVDHSILAHYHEDYTMITTYLAFQFPEKYTIYEDAAYRSMLKLLGSQSNTSGGITKFMVLLRSLNENYLQKDRSIMDIYRLKLEKEFHHTSNSTMLVHDFYTSLRELSDGPPN
jgi:hypothetical protein